MPRGLWRWLASWWCTLYLGAVILTLALSPSSYQGANRLAVARHVYLDTAPILPGFMALSALIGVVLTRIVVVTALSYGLSQYALNMLVRVLVLELIPLTAALFVALRCTIPHGEEISSLRIRGELAALQARGLDPIRAELMPRVVAGVFAVVSLAAVSCVVSLLLAYVGVYGFTSGGLPAYTRLVGQVFTPPVSLIFMLKTVLLGLAVALIPVTSGYYGFRDAGSRTSAELQGLVRLFVVMLLIEAAALVGNYY